MPSTLEECAFFALFSDAMVHDPAPTLAVSISSPNEYALGSSNDQATTTPRPHACHAEGCGKTFRRRSTLNEHVRTHSGEKSFCCPVASCQRRFSTSGNLSRHKRAQHAWLDTPLECLVDDCGCTFTSDRKLERHMAMVHFSASAHSCRVRQCGRAFSTAGNLRRHVKQHHGENGSDPSDGSSSSSYVEMTLRQDAVVMAPASCRIDTSSPAAVNDLAFEPMTMLWSRHCPPMDRLSLCSDGELLETLASLFEESARDLV